MKFIHLFLIGYFVLVVGVALALWQTGVLNRVAPIWVLIGLLVSVGVGIMMSVSSGNPRSPRSNSPPSARPLSRHGFAEARDRVSSLPQGTANGSFNVADGFVDLTLGLQIVVARQRAHDLLDLALRLIDLAVTLVLVPHVKTSRRGCGNRRRGVCAIEDSLFLHIAIAEGEFQASALGKLGGSAASRSAD